MLSTRTHQILSLLLVCVLLSPFEVVFLGLKCRAQDGPKVLGWCPRGLHCALQWRSDCGGLASRIVVVVRVWHLDGLVSIDVAETHVGDLGLCHDVVCRQIAKG